jgi:hypothetical protein
MNRETPKIKIQSLKCIMIYLFQKGFYKIFHYLLVYIIIKKPNI